MARRALVPVALGMALLASVLVANAAEADVPETQQYLPPECAGATGRSADQIKARYPVHQTDQLEVVYLDGCALENIYADGGAHKSERDLGIWRPAWNVQRAFPGFSYPGDMAITTEDKGWNIASADRYATFMVKPKKGFEAYITKPKDFSFVGWDKHSGAGQSLTLYQANCPEGFVALGLYAAGSYPTTDDLDSKFHLNDFFPRAGCFDRSMTTKLEPYSGGKDADGSLYSTHGEMDDDVMDWAIYGVQRPSDIKAGKNTVVVPPSTFWAKRDTFEKPSADLFRGLKLPLTPPDIQTPASAAPKLAGPSTDGWKAVNKAQTSSYYVSALVVDDPDYDGNELAKLIASPVYKVVRTTQWKPVGEALTCPAENTQSCTLTRTESTSESQSDTWSKTLGQGSSLTVTGKANFAPLGVGGELSVSIGLSQSYEYQWGGDTTRGSESGTDSGGTVNPGTFATWAQAESTYQVYRKATPPDPAADPAAPEKADDPRNLVGSAHTSSPKGLNRLLTMKLPPEPGETATCGAKGTDGEAVECTMPLSELGAMEANVPIFSKSGNHYLFLSEGGALELRDAEDGIEQDSSLWSLDLNNQHGRVGHPITSVSFTNGQLVVKAAGLEDWKSSSKEYPKATLEITDTGNLRIMNGKTPVWTSSADLKTYKKNLANAKKDQTDEEED